MWNHIRKYPYPMMVVPHEKLQLAKWFHLISSLPGKALRTLVDIARLAKKKTKIGFQDGLSLNAGQKYCRMPQESILQYF